MNHVSKLSLFSANNTHCHSGQLSKILSPSEKNASEIWILKYLFSFLALSQLCKQGQITIKGHFC
jgi:hypothetical protein